MKFNTLWNFKSFNSELALIPTFNSLLLLILVQTQREDVRKCQNQRHIERSKILLNLNGLCWVFYPKTKNLVTFSHKFGPWNAGSFFQYIYRMKKSKNWKLFHIFDS